MTSYASVLQYLKTVAGMFSFAHLVQLSGAVFLIRFEVMEEFGSNLSVQWTSVISYHNQNHCLIPEVPKVSLQ